MELDDPGVGQRKHAEWTQPREGRGQREVRQSQHAAEGRKVGEHRVDLLAADDADRDDRAAGAQRQLDKTTAAEPPQPVALAVGLAGSLDTLGKDEHQLVAVQQSLRVVRMSQGVAGAAEEPRRHRDAEEGVEDQRPRVSRRRMVGVDRSADHRPVVGQHARVVGHQQGAPSAGHVLETDRPHSPVVPVQPGEEGHQGLGPLAVEAELVDLVVAAAPPRGELRLRTAERCEPRGRLAKRRRSAEHRAQHLRPLRCQSRDLAADRAQPLDRDRRRIGRLEAGAAAARQLLLGGPLQAQQLRSQRILLAGALADRTALGAQGHCPVELLAHATHVEADIAFVGGTTRSCR